MNKKWKLNHVQKQIDKIWQKWIENRLYDKKENLHLAIKAMITARLNITHMVKNITNMRKIAIAKLNVFYYYLYHISIYKNTTLNIKSIGKKQ